MRVCLVCSLLLVFAGCGQSTTSITPDGGTHGDAASGADAATGDDAAVDDDAATGDDAASTSDAGPMCSADSFGWCPSGTDCLACPTGPISQVLLCTTHCTSDGDCTDAARPTCSRDTITGANGICVPAGQTCVWGVRCAAPTTMIATPSGERPISELVVGDLVYTADSSMLVAVPLAAVHRSPVDGEHRVVRVTLETGRVLEISPGHPTADGRFFGDLHAGDFLDGARVLSAELELYPYDATYDILPSSDTATYVAGGVLIGSTLAM